MTTKSNSVGCKPDTPLYSLEHSNRVVLLSCSRQHFCIAFAFILSSPLAVAAAQSANPTVLGISYLLLGIIFVAILATAVVVWLSFIRSRNAGQRLEVDQTLAKFGMKKTEDRKQAFLDAIPDLMLLQTRDGVYLDFHARNLKDLIVPPNEFLGKNMRDVLPPQLAQRFFDCFERAVDGQPQVLEYMLNLDDVERCFEARVVTKGNEVLSVIRDVTSRKFTEEALKRNEAQLAGIIESAMDGIITIDDSQRIVLFNSAAEEIFGCSSAYALGQYLDRFIPKRFHGNLLEFGDPPVTRSNGQLRDLQGLRPSGDEFPLEASVSQIEVNDQRLLTIILRDITERKRAIDELRLSESRFAKAFRANPQPMSITTVEDGLYMDVNQSFLAMSGYTREEVIGRTSIDLGIWDSQEARASFVREIKEAGSVVNQETRFHTKTGELRVLLSSAEQLEIGGEQCVLIVAIDITERNEAEVALRKAHEELQELKNQLEAENIYLQEELQQFDEAFNEIIGHSDAIKYVLSKISQVAPTDSTVLITGETGTGKELIARAIHGASSRRERPLIKVNCATLSASLIESELFGHEKGAFTGAGMRRLGRFELADGGTLFLDEIGELPLQLQGKLLRVLQEGEFERVGGSKTIKVRVRIIAATNRNLKTELDNGTFREDLWYRLNVFPITVPPLRQRKEDIPLLVDHFVRLSAKRLGKTILSVSPRSMNALQSHSWPGNVRELANVLERAVINTHGSVLHLVDTFEPMNELQTSALRLDEIEREHIIRTLEHTGWRVEGPFGAAKILGLNASTLRARMSKLGIHRPRANVV